MNPFSQTLFRWHLSASKRICKGQGHCWRFLKVFGLHVANQVEHFQMVMWRMLSKQKLHWSLTISWSHEMVCAKYCIMVRATCSIKLNTSTSRQVATASLTSSSWNLCWRVHLFVSWMCQTTTISETRGERCATVTKLPEHKLPIPAKTRVADEHQCQQTKFQESYKAWAGLSKKGKKKHVKKKMFESQTSVKWTFCGNFACLGFFSRILSKT